MRKRGKKQKRHLECQICGETIALDVHHIVPLFAGGKDNEFNRVVVCPNHHRVIHLGLIKIHG